MSSYLEKRWIWEVNTVYENNEEQDVDLFIFEYDSDNVIQAVSDNNGKINKIITEAIYKIDNENDITETRKTPHSISVVKYGLKPKGLIISFLGNRIDTFYMEKNNNITESDKDVVSGYSGIEIDHSNREIKITEDHTIEELYDYCQYDMTINPVKEYLEGIFVTKDGNNYELYYDLIIDGCNLDGENKYIDMHNNEKSLINSGSTNVRIKDKNGMTVGLSVKVYDISTGNPIENVRVYLKDEDGNILINNTTNSDGSVMVSYVYTGNINVTGKARKASEEPYYRGTVFSGTITEIGFSINLFLVKDE